jgi:hypothetical protein
MSPYKVDANNQDEISNKKLYYWLQVCFLYSRIAGYQLLMAVTMANADRNVCNGFFLRNVRRLLEVGIPFMLIF